MEGSPVPLVATVRSLLPGQQTSLLTQSHRRFVGSFDTVIQTLVNVDTGERAPYIVYGDKPFSYGKNWAPFVFNDELYMIHSFGPLRILKDNRVWKEVENPVVPKVCYPGGKPFCMFRGGTNGAQFSTWWKTSRG